MLFVSSTTGGGSGRSQRELAARLVAAGHEVHLLVDDTSSARIRRWLYEQLSDASVRLAEGRLGGLLRRLERRPGRRARSTRIEGLDHRISPVPENALEAALEELRPEVVVGNSLVRLSWRRVRAACAARDIPTVLYVREVTSLDHLIEGELPDAVVANARSLATTVEQRGIPCTFIPSVIDVDRTRTSTTRRAALIVHPVASHGVQLVWELARRLPEVPFVLQESRPLGRDQLRALARAASQHANVELRRAVPPGPRLYHDIRVLLAPHRLDNRPRVAYEAQANGIPVLASSFPGLREAVGDGGACVDPDDVEGWMQAVRELWTDEPRYDDLSRRALAHSRRPDVDADAVTEQFEALLLQVVSAHAR